MRRRSGFGGALKACAPHFATAAIFSFAINILHLAPPLFMMQVYDRVLSSGNGATLLLMTVALLVSLAATAALDAARAHVLLAAGVRLDRMLVPAIVGAALAPVDRPGHSAARPVEDFDGLRQCLTGPVACAVLDLPWVPVHVLVLSLMHPSLGIFAIGSAGVLALFGLAAERFARRPAEEAGSAARAAGLMLDRAREIPGTVAGLGMLRAITSRWSECREDALAAQQQAAERGATTSAVARAARHAMQSLVLALGAWLVIEGAASAGIMLAASLLLGRALQPVEQLAGSLRSVGAAVKAFRCLARLLSTEAPVSRRLPGSRSDTLICEGIGWAPPAAGRPILHGVNLQLMPGVTLILGPSGSGKSTLLAIMAGALSPSAGTVRAPADSGSIGYLPQRDRLFPGTIAWNIARGAAGPDGDVQRAAALAGAHDAILRLPMGYATELDHGAVAVSAGLARRISLARALFRSPRILLLDEPARDLDATGETALARLVANLRAARTTVLIVSHRPSLIATADTIAIMQAGTIVSVGPRREIIAHLDRAPQAGRGRTAWPT